MYKKLFADGKFSGLSAEFSSPLCEKALAQGIPTVKIDGSACAIINGTLYHRYDVKWGRKVPLDCIPCQAEADATTGHYPVWVKCNDTKADMWFLVAYNNTGGVLKDGTYEAVGRHFQSNPYKLDYDILVRHGVNIIQTPMHTIEAVRGYLTQHNIEGIVWWLDGEPICKLRRKDFFLPWVDKTKPVGFYVKD